jgi:uncharacterized membrane protein
MEEYRSLSIKKLKDHARGRLIGRYGTAFLAALTILGAELIITFFSGTGDSTPARYLLTLLIFTVADLLMGVLEYGESNLYLKITRSAKDVSVQDLFIGFKKNTDKAILVRAVFTGFSLIGIIPAALYALKPDLFPAINATLLAVLLSVFEYLVLFIAKLFFGLSFYILCDESGLTAKEILLKSLDLMKNKKGRLITIYLSMIPLCIVSILAFGIGFIWFTILLKAVVAMFYNDMLGEMTGTLPIESATPDGSSTLDIRL